MIDIPNQGWFHDALNIGCFQKQAGFNSGLISAILFTLYYQWRGVEWDDISGDIGLGFELDIIDCHRVDLEGGSELLICIFMGILSISSVVDEDWQFYEGFLYMSIDMGMM